jgi:hypothetical protein
MPGMAPRTGMAGPMDLELNVDPYPEGGEEEAPCEHCGAPLGMPCEPGCPNEVPMEPDPDRAYDARVDVQREGKEMTEFDKFMDRTVIDERQRVRVDRKEENNPQRQRAARYQDRPMNKTRFVRGGR